MAFLEGSVVGACAACCVGCGTPALIAEGIGRGYLDGWTGLGSRPDPLVKGWVASGSKVARMDCVMMNVEYDKKGFVKTQETS